jgi:hypothetical protein
MRPPLCGGLIIFPNLSREGSLVVRRPDSPQPGLDTIVWPVRPATAIVLVILLVLIAVAGVIQLLTILSPPG